MDRRKFVCAVGGALAACGMPGARMGSSAAESRQEEPFDSAAFHAARRYADTSLGRVAYVERGRGSAALFLHGFPLNGFQWRGALERLSTYRRCVAPDLLGMGYTQVKEGVIPAPSAQVTMLVELLDALSIRSAEVVANDSGGAVAQLLVAQHPARVRSLLLTNCDTEMDSPPPALAPVIELAHQGLYAERWLVPWVADKTLARSPEGLGGLTYTFPERLADETIDCYLAPLVASSRRKRLTDAYAIALEHNPLAGIEPLLRRSSVPMRVVWGTGDTIFSASSPQYLDSSFGNSLGVRRVEGAKLFFPEEFPDLIAEEARSLWLRKHS